MKTWHKIAIAGGLAGWLLLGAVMYREDPPGGCCGFRVPQIVSVR